VTRYIATKNPRERGREREREGEICGGESEEEEEDIYCALLFRSSLSL